MKKKVLSGIVFSIAFFISMSSSVNFAAAVCSSITCINDYPCFNRCDGSYFYYQLGNGICPPATSGICFWSSTRHCFYNNRVCADSDASDNFPNIGFVRTCAAQCDQNSDCTNYCSGNIRYYNGNCLGSCTCSYSTEDCDALDGWYDTGNTQWVSTGQCTEKEQKEQEDRNYYCDPSGCLFSISGTRWADTGNTRNKLDGTTCDDGLFCTVNDQCSSGICSGATRDCSDQNECTNDICNEDLDVCQYISAASGTPCGLARDCPPDACNGPFAEFYPDDGHDICDGSGNCLVHSCALENSYCSDNNPNDGKNDLMCGATCDQDSDCDDGNPYNIDICLGDCVCQHEMPAMPSISPVTMIVLLGLLLTIGAKKIKV